MEKLPNDIFFASVESILAEGQSVKITVQGTSMRPTFRNGKDYVIVAPVRNNGAVLENDATIKHDRVAEKTRSKNASKGDDRLTIRRRDIVLFRYGQTGTIQLHRIVHIWGTLLHIRGDGCYGPYQRATVSDVIGIVVEGTCFSGHHFLASSYGWRTFSKFWTATYRPRLCLLLIWRIISKPFRRRKKRSGK